jgi:hypothetical protein
LLRKWLTILFKYIEGTIMLTRKIIDAVEAAFSKVISYNGGDAEHTAADAVELLDKCFMEQKSRRLYRAVIMQPSTLQPLHHLDRTPCIVVEFGDTDNVQLWFSTGPIHSMVAPRLCVSRVKLSSAG